MTDLSLLNKLSQLLKLAVQDCRRVEKDPGVVFDMGIWHSPTIGNKCEVCMAGAVMDQSLKISRTEEKSPFDFVQKDISRKLSAINSMRSGYLTSAAKHLGIDLPDESVNRTFFEIINETYDLAKGLADWESYEEAWEYLHRNDL